MAIALTSLAGMPNHNNEPVATCCLDLKLAPESQQICFADRSIIFLVFQKSLLTLFFEFVLTEFAGVKLSCLFARIYTSLLAMRADPRSFRDRIGGLHPMWIHNFSVEEHLLCPRFSGRCGNVWELAQVAAQVQSDIKNSDVRLMRGREERDPAIGKAISASGASRWRFAKNAVN